jgi:hypothetical protein
VYLGQRLQGRRPPTWFVEGVAQLQAGEWNFGDTISLVQVASFGGLPRLSLLQAQFPAGGRSAELAYRVSRQAVLDIERQGSGRGGWRAVVEAMAQGQGFSQALVSVVGAGPAEFEAAVDNRLRIRYGWIAGVASASSLFTLMTLLFIVGGIRTRIRARQRLREMEEDEERFGSDLES